MIIAQFRDVLGLGLIDANKGVAGFRMQVEFGRRLGAYIAFIHSQHQVPMGGGFAVMSELFG